MIFTFLVCDALALYALKVVICTQLLYIVFLTKEKKIQRKVQAKLFKTEMPFSLIFKEFLIFTNLNCQRKTYNFNLNWKDVMLVIVVSMVRMSQLLVDSLLSGTT